MSLPVLILPPAILDVVHAKRYLEDKRPGLGESFNDEVDRICAQISEHPELYQRVNKIHRRAAIHRFNYVFIYRILLTHIEVTAVLHCRLSPAFTEMRTRG